MCSKSHCYKVYYSRSLAIEILWTLVEPTSEFYVACVEAARLDIKKVAYRDVHFEASYEMEDRRRFELFRAQPNRPMKEIEEEIFQEIVADYRDRYMVNGLLKLSKHSSSILAIVGYGLFDFSPSTILQFIDIALEPCSRVSLLLPLSIDVLFGTTALSSLFVTAPSIHILRKVYGQWPTRTLKRKFVYSSSCWQEIPTGPETDLAKMDEIEYQVFQEIVVDYTDRYMVNGLLELSKHSSSILAIVGYGHLPGMKHCRKRKQVDFSIPSTTLSHEAIA